VYKVPSNDVEALKSPLMGLFEKRRARKFFIFVQNYEEADAKTHDGRDLRTATTKELFE
jgi:Rab GDP dissociation inhibitor